MPWTAAYIDTIGEPTADLRSNIAAEARAKILYERLMNVTDDPGIKEALGFLMTREISHQKSFEKALYAIQDNFPPGKRPAMEPYADVYVNTSQGPGDSLGPWNEGPQWTRVDDLMQKLPVDGGDGQASVKLNPKEQEAVKAAAARLHSDARIDPITGADLGAGPGAGRTTRIEGLQPARTKATVQAEMPEPMKMLKILQPEPSGRASRVHGVYPRAAKPEGLPAGMTRMGV